VLLSLRPGPTQHFGLCHATVPKRRYRRGPGAKYVTYIFLLSPRPPLDWGGGGVGRKHYYTGARTRSRRPCLANVHAGTGEENEKCEPMYGWPNRDTAPEFASRDWGKPLKIGQNGRHSRKNSHPTPPSSNSSLWVAYCYTTPLSQCVISFQVSLPSFTLHTLSPLSETRGAEFFAVCSTQDQNMYILTDLIWRLLPTKYYIFFKNDHRPVSLQTLFPYKVSKYILEI
jgi:hypothetical protein